MMRCSPLSIIRILAIAMLAMAAFATPAYAQDAEEEDDDTQGDDVVAEATEFVANIYEGTVDDFSQEPVGEAAVLELLSENDDDPDDQIEEIWRAISSDDETPPGVFYGDDGDTDLTVEELASEPHVLVIHAGEDANEPVIAAGDIEGDVGEGGILIIDLQEVDGSGYEGRAFFGPDDDSGDASGQEDSGDVEQVVGGEAGGEPAGEDDDDDDDGAGETDVIVGLWQKPTQGV